MRLCCSNQNNKNKKKRSQLMTLFIVGMLAFFLVPSLKRILYNIVRFNCPPTADRFIVVEVYGSVRVCGSGSYPNW